MQPSTRWPSLRTQPFCMLRARVHSCIQAEAVKALLAHRLSPDDPLSAMHEWDDILSGKHPLWDGVSEPYKQVL